MKLKTSHPFWPNQFFSKLLIISSIGITGGAFSQDSKTPPPGIIESFERLSELSKDQYQKSNSRIQSNLNIISDISALQEVKISPDFIKNLIINSDEQFLRLSNKDECRFLSILENNLLKTSEGNPENILIEYKSNGKIESAAVPRQNFFEQAYKQKCLNNREFSILFSEANAIKTIEGIRFTIPKTKEQCSVVHKEWFENSYTPYLCRIQQIMKRSPNKRQADFYKERVSTLQRTYLDNLCGSLTSSDEFCSHYMKNDAWSRISNSELPSYKIAYKCIDILKQAGGLSETDLKNCAAKLASDDKFCESRGNSEFPSNFPLQSCSNISLMLNNSKLITDYHDCPGAIDNEAITNVHRIINHFAPRKMTSTRDSCASETNYTFARLNLDINYEAGWPLKVCYLNRVDNKEACTPYIPGKRENEPLSEDQVIAKILYRQKGAPPKTTCRIVDSKTYNPLRSEFKYGCFIVYNADSCTTLSCDKKVIWEEQHQTDIKFIGKTSFDYFPTAFMNERYAFTNLVNEVYKTQERIIRNYTDLTFQLDKLSNGIVHGIGCAEDLVPETFQRSSINQCQPLPFIIDGVTKRNGENFVVTRLSIDDIHTPRLIQWTNIYNSVSAYQELHPLNTWTLYGIKK